MSSPIVLIVDDDPTFSDSFKRLLETSYGVEDVQVCSSEKKAIQTAESSFTGFTHIFVDCVIPGSDGVGLSEVLHKINTAKMQEGKTFLISGFVDISMLPDDLSHLAGSLKKPLDDDELSKYFEQKSVIKKIDFFSKFNGIEELIANCSETEYDSCMEFIPILSQLMQFEFTGKIVLITKGTDSSVIFMSQGEFNHITDSNTEAPLGEQLVENGYISLSQVKSSLESDQFKNNKLKIGNFLIQKNLLSPHAVDEVVGIQTRGRFEKILKYEKFKVSFIIEKVEKKNETLTFSDYFNCLKNMMELEKSYMFTLSRKHLSEVEALHPTPQYTRLKASKDISLDSDNVKTRFLLVLSGAATLQEDDENPELVTRADLNFANKILTMNDPYAVLGVEQSDATDSTIAKSYHKIAKKIHPDRLETLNLSQEEEDLVQKGFAKLTADFNKIKTADKRQNNEARKLLENEKNKRKVNELVNLSIELLYKGQYREAAKTVQSIKNSFPNETHEKLPMITLWTQLKSSKKVDINKAVEIIDSFSGVEKTSQEHYLMALVCKISGDGDGFIKNLKVSIQIDNSFLPARREYVQYKSEVKKAQSAKKSNSTFGSLFSSKK